MLTLTVPSLLARWIRSHPRVGYRLLFTASWQALSDLAANPKYLGGQLGALGVLQTWSRTLIYHPHIHFLVPSGALSQDQTQWIPAKHPQYLVPFTPLADRFRHCFYQRLQDEQPDALIDIAKGTFKQR